MRILITSAGTVTAQSLIKALRADSRKHCIVAGDMEELNAAKAFADAFVLLPPAGHEAYAERCLEVVRAHSIRLLVPIIVEREFLPLIVRRSDFAALGCTLSVPAKDVIETIADKLHFAAFVRSIGIDTPHTVAYSEGITLPRFPVYLKPRWGSGSVGTLSVESLPSLREAAEGRSDLIVQEAVSGLEFTVDCFAPEPGRVAAVVPRLRIAIKAGVSVKGRTFRHEKMEDVCSRLVEASGINGPANIQGMLRDDGSFVVIEMNPRFSGTLALTTAAGINLGSLLVDAVEGIAIPDLRGMHRAGIAMSRYWQEVFEDSDGNFWIGPGMARSEERTM